MNGNPSTVVEVASEEELHDIISYLYNRGYTKFGVSRTYFSSVEHMYKRALSAFRIYSMPGTSKLALRYVDDYDTIHYSSLQGYQSSLDNEDFNIQSFKTVSEVLSNNMNTLLDSLDEKIAAMEERLKPE